MFNDPPSPTRLCHLVLTRFNLRTSVTGGRDVTARDWLLDRLALFETFCLPSMKAQTASHEWLVWFDSGTPSEIRERVDSHDGYTPIYVDGTLGDEAMRETLAGRVPSDATHLVTTRLDNDDAVAESFLARVQLAAVHQPRPAFLNMAFGYQWQDGRFYYSIQRSNPFLSYVEPVRRGEARLGIQSVAHGNHDRIRKTGDLRQIWAPPSWLQVLHGGNVANEFKGLRRVTGEPPSGFADLPVTAEPWPARAFDLARSAGHGVTTPWRKRRQVHQRLRANARASRRHR
jgi:hypothetical protein